MAKEQWSRDPSNPGDDDSGDARDFLAYDPEHLPVLAVAPGRTDESPEAIVPEVKGRRGGAAPDLITDGQLPACAEANKVVFSDLGMRNSGVLGLSTRFRHFGCVTDVLGQPPDDPQVLP